MGYRLDIGGEIVAVDLSLNAGGSSRAVIDEVAHDLDRRVIGEGHYRIVLDGRAAEVFVAPAPDGKHVFIDGRCYLVKEADAAGAKRRRGGPDETPGDVTPPMPAVVVRVLAAVGDRVDKGRGLVVVSAMKMETTLVAPFSGTVTKINCAVGDKVAPGDRLVEIDAEATQS